MMLAHMYLVGFCFLLCKQRRYPALPNALKYAVSLLVVLFGALHPTVVASFSAETAWIQAAWLLSYLGTTLYTFFWAVYMDWRCRRSQ